MSRILVVDDKELMRDSVSTALARRGHTIVVAPSGTAALEKLAQRSPDVIVTDLQMPEMNGVELLREVRKADEQIPVILMTAFGTIENAVSAMKQGAFDYITKPFTGDELVLTVERALEHAALVKENLILRATASTGSRGESNEPVMLGSSAVMNALQHRLGRIADSHGTVLITGESGSGKEVAARWIHANSPRRKAPFLAINCAALSTNLLESELFGHEKGAFTGADKLRKGRFELADGGTLLLDEISEVAPEIQAKLLRVLQERTFERVGSSQSRSADVRVIATTNRDLPAEVQAGTFRQDLFFRLNVLPVPMPALRERLEDLGELVNHFLASVARREGKAAKRLTPDAIELLACYDWPGNVRELQNVCERAAVLTSGEVIAADLIGPWLSAQPAAPRRASATIEVMPNISLPAPVSAARAEANGANVPVIVCDGRLTLEDIERETIVATLQHHHGHRQRSAAALGIGVRTLGLKLKKWKEMQLVAETL